jgi:hypothetical protein
MTNIKQSTKKPNSACCLWITKLKSMDGSRIIGIDDINEQRSDRRK